jgi:hypothetical protein
VADEVGGDPVEPGPYARALRVVPSPVPERFQESLGHQVVGRVRAETTGDVAVDLAGVPPVQRREPLGIGKGGGDDLGVGERLGDHH